MAGPIRRALAAAARQFADVVGQPAFAGTPYPTGQTPPNELRTDIGGTGTFNFGGFIRGEDPTPEMDALTAVANLDIMRRTDAQVNASLQVVMQPIRSADTSIDAASDDPQDQLAAELCEWNLFSGEGIGWDDFLRQALLMLVFGYYIFEKVWTTQEGGPWDGATRLARLSPRPPKTIWQWFTDEDGRLLSIKQLAVKAGTYQFLDLPADKIVRFTYNQEGDNFQGMSILRAAYPHWRIKQELYVVDAIRAYRFGAGIPRATFKAGYAPNATTKANLIDTLQSMASHQHSWIIQPEEVTIDILMPQGGGGKGGVDVMTTINHHNEQISRNVLATFLDMGGKSMGGSNALGSSSMDFFTNAITAVSDQVADVVNRDILRPLVDANFEVTEYPTFRFSGIKQRDLKSIAAIIASLSQAGMSFSDIETENTFRDLLDLPERTDTTSNTAGEDPTNPANIATGKAGTPQVPPATPSSSTGGGAATSGAPGASKAKSAGPAGHAATSAKGPTTAQTSAPAGPATSPVEAAEPAVAQPGAPGVAVARQPDPSPEPDLRVTPFPQSARPANPPTAAEAQATAPVDHTERARTTESGVVPARSNTWDSTVAVPSQERTTDAMDPNASTTIPPTAHMARSSTITSSGATDEEGAPSTKGFSVESPPPPGRTSRSIPTRSTKSAEPATTAIRTRQTARPEMPTGSSVAISHQTGRSHARTGATATTSLDDRPTTPTVGFWRTPTPLELRVLDLREMPRRLDIARAASLNTLRNIREEQISRIASAVASAPAGEIIKAPLVGKMADALASVVTPVFEFGMQTVQREIQTQLAARGGRRMADTDTDWEEEKHPRGPGGKFASGSSDKSSTKDTDPKETFKGLRTQYAKTNDQILSILDQAQGPASPEVQAKMDELRGIVKQMNDMPPGSSGVGVAGARDVLIVGAGPGGLTAACAAATDGLNTLVVDTNATPGGQPRSSSRIENYPGFPVGVSGEKLTGDMYAQAQLHGADTKLGTSVTGITYDDATGLKTVTMSDGTTETARAVVIAGGLQYRSLDFDGVDAGRITYGDGQLMASQAKGGPVVVVGGSNGAAQAALGAARTSSSVTLVSRSSIEKGMSQYQQDAIRSSPKITLMENDEIASATKDADWNVASVRLKSGADVPTKAVGIFAGAVPSTSWLPAGISKESNGLITVNHDTLETTMPGVFAIGDTRSGQRASRIGSAVGDGMNVEKNLFDYYAKTSKTTGHG